MSRVKRNRSQAKERSKCWCWRFLKRMVSFIFVQTNLSAWF